MESNHRRRKFEAQEDVTSRNLGKDGTETHRQAIRDEQP
jgi:hypothetical protein